MKKKKFSKDKVQIVSFESEKKTNKKMLTVLVMGILVFLMIFSIIAIGFNDSGNAPSSEDLTYNGFEFKNQGGGWFTLINGINYGFEYSPVDVEIIPAVDLKNEVFGVKSYVLYDPREFSPVNPELIRLRTFLSSRGTVANFACASDEGCGDLPLVDCNNSNNVIYLKNADKTEIYREDNCIVLSAVNGEEIKVINRFMYSILSVM